MEKETQGQEVEVAQDLEVLEEGQAGTEDLMACCKAGTGSARV